jgi:hypothetical protein
MGGREERAQTGTAQKSETTAILHSELINEVYYYNSPEAQRRENV